jgi:hypothetical protein
MRRGHLVQSFSQTRRTNGLPDNVPQLSAVPTTRQVQVDKRPLRRWTIGSRRSEGFYDAWEKQEPAASGTIVS